MIYTRVGNTPVTVIGGSRAGNVLVLCEGEEIPLETDISELVADGAMWEILMAIHKVNAQEVGDAQA